MITDWTLYSSPSLYSLPHLWLYRLISSNEIISRWSQATFTGSNTFFRPDLHSLVAQWSVATATLSPHTIISHRPSCDPVLSPVCHVSLPSATLHIVHKQYTMTNQDSGFHSFSLCISFLFVSMSVLLTVSDNFYQIHFTSQISKWEIYIYKNYFILCKYVQSSSPKNHLRLTQQFCYAFTITI